MRRDPSPTRYYLEAAASDSLPDWSEDRVREELAIRLGAGGGLQGVRFVEPTFVDLRVRMTEPMQEDRVFLAGDAAHLITPAGGKGMNLAIQDAVELASGLIERFGSIQDGRRLTHYSETRLPELWKVQAFSSWMLRLLLARPHNPSKLADDGNEFALDVRDGWVRLLRDTTIH